MLSDFLWHFNFNRAYDVNERLVEGREEIYFGYQFATKAATPTTIPDYAVKVYVDSLKSPEALRASFEYYRSIDDIKYHYKLLFNQLIANSIVFYATNSRYNRTSVVGCFPGGAADGWWQKDWPTEAVLYDLAGNDGKSRILDPGKPDCRM